MAAAGPPTPMDGRWTDRLHALPSVRKNASPLGEHRLVCVPRPSVASLLQERGFLAVVSAVCFHGGRVRGRGEGEHGRRWVACRLWRPNWRNQITPETTTPELRHIFRPSVCVVNVKGFQ